MRAGLFFRMNKASFTRREFFRFVGRGAAGGLALHALGPLYAGERGPRLSRIGLNWTPVPYPVPLPGDPGSAAQDAVRLARFEVIDDLVLPSGFRYDVVARWGERFGPSDQPDRQVVFGYNADFVALLPADRPDEFFLFVNHEYISATPWLQGYEEVFGQALHQDGAIGDHMLAGGELDLAEIPSSRLSVAKGVRTLCRAAMADLGVSILRVRRAAGGGYEVVRQATDHRRIHGWGRSNIAAETPLMMTGPVASAFAFPVPGTFCNCSGGVTPWGTALTCEENYQDQTVEQVTPSGRNLPCGEPLFSGSESLSAAGLPFEFNGLCSGLHPRPDGRAFGWVCEVDPATGALWKHSALGRFRHENVALRVEAGRPLVAYMGDDRRGGHVWKFVSEAPVHDLCDPANRRLFERGTLYVARFAADFSGTWIPLRPETSLRRPEPDTCAGGFVWLPDRPSGGWVAVGEHPALSTISPETWMERMSDYVGKPFAAITLGDLIADGVDPLAVLLLDAFVMAQAIGGTPTARPEDLEVHPHDQSVYIAFTDSTGSGDGSPDARIFPDSRGDNSRQYGAIFRLVEEGNHPDATTFVWGKFVASGECAEGGGGFACADNLAFDPDGHLWMVTDISTTSHNFPVNRDVDSQPGKSKFTGIFGNNALFVIPTAGPDAGTPKCFATGPMECEMTGPWYTDDDAILIAIQHPGEAVGARGFPGIEQPTEISDRHIVIAGRDGRLFTQSRTVPRGSNFPDNRPGAVPKPCVVCIRRG